MPISFKQGVRRVPLVRPIYHRLRTLISGMRSTLNKLRGPLLTAGLILVYFVLITPLAFAARILFRRNLVSPQANSMSGWRSIDQSSSDKRIFFGSH
jgi:hypothetical protein